MSSLSLIFTTLLLFCGLEANGKIKPEDAYDEIRKFWKQLKHSKQELLDDTDFTPEE
ncbi:MAG: hypothetical protein AAFR62_21860 [Cyanobacteria bacterium J06629_2]